MPSELYNKDTTAAKISPFFVVFFCSLAAIMYGTQNQIDTLENKNKHKHKLILILMLLIIKLISNCFCSVNL